MKSLSRVRLCNPMDCSPPGFSIHGIFQAGVLEWTAVSFARGIFLTQGLNPGLPHCRQMLYRLSQMLNSSYKINIFKNTVKKLRRPNSISQVALAQVLLGHCLGLTCGWLWGALSRKQSLVEGLNGEHSLFITCRGFHLSHPGSTPWVGKIPLDKGMATYFSILAWRTPVDRGHWRATTWGEVVKSWTRLSNSAQHSVSQRPISSFLLPKPKSICLTCAHHGNESKWCI